MPRQIAFRRWAPPIAAGLLYALSFPPFGYSFLAWFSLAPLLWSLNGEARTARSAFTDGFFALFLAQLVIFWWLWPTFNAARVHPVTTFACWLAMCAILALYGGAFALFYRSIPAAWARVWLAAAAWVALEEVRTIVLTGFPWALASHTQARLPAVIQIASVTGAPGVSFLIILMCSAIAEIARAFADRRFKWSTVRSCALALMAFLGAVIWGQARVVRAKTRPDTGRAITVALLQGNIDQYRKWDDAYEADVRAVYARLVRDASETETPDLYVWPETAVPGWIPRDPFYTRWIAEIARSTRRPHLIGALSGDEKGDYNAAILVSAEGKLVGQYNKLHLVPFGEYIPVGGFLKGVIPYLGHVGTFDPGRGAEVFDVGGVRLAPNICYEAMFPALVRRSARNADMIINITNDGWFLASSAPEQHFVTNLYRAVENGKPVVRAANTGISAFISAQGRVILESGLLGRGAYTQRVPVPPPGSRTFYSRWGNWLGWLCLLIAVGWTIVAITGRPASFLYTRRHQNVPRTQNTN